MSFKLNRMQNFVVVIFGVPTQMKLLIERAFALFERIMTASGRFSTISKSGKSDAALQ